MALTFSEVVYRILDTGGAEEATRVAGDLCKGIEELVDAPLQLQWSLPGIGHRCDILNGYQRKQAGCQNNFERRLSSCMCRYMVAESCDALYVAFMGTKQMRDVATNANISLSPLRPTEAAKVQVSEQDSLLLIPLEFAESLATQLLVDLKSSNCRALQKLTQVSCSEPVPSALAHCRSARRHLGCG